MSCATPAGVAIDLVRLTEVPLEQVHALLGEPRLRRHMPLPNEVSREEAAARVPAKDAQWVESGHGPWAVLLTYDGVTFRRFRLTREAWEAARQPVRPGASARPPSPRPHP